MSFSGIRDRNRFHLNYGEIQLLDRIADIEAKILGMKISFEKAKENEIYQNINFNNNIFPETETF